TTYDTRYVLGMSVVSLVLLKLSNIKSHQICFVIKFIAIFSLLNILRVYLFAPEYCVYLYQSRTVIWEGNGGFTLTEV
ncbi:energy-coupling factor transporter transmembrane protein EcfT, partial [Enterococcus faecalis]